MKGRKYLCETKRMNINVNHPSFISFIDNVTKNILSEIDINNYFSNPPDRRLKLQKGTLTVLKKNLKTRALVSDTEIKGFVIVLQKKNEQMENYEVSGILKDIILNFDSINPPSDKKNTSMTKINQ
jgi:hypothetical protein